MYKIKITKTKLSRSILFNMVLILAVFIQVNTAKAATNGRVKIPAFPGAEGYGAYSAGGRGGRIIEVTNLNESGEGSLRAAIEASGPRIVIFRVGGYIDLTSPIKLTDPYITIAGQTAPGDGICLRMKPGNPQGIKGLIYVSSGSDNLHDVVIRYIKFRQGWSLTYKGNGGPRPHNLYFRRGHDVIIDHVSSQWTRDNLITISLSSSAVESDSMYNFTLQKTLLGESEDGHSTGINIQGGSASTCEYTGKWVKRISVHRNLFIGNDHRNPRTSVKNVKVINNLIYNWGPSRAGSTTRDVIVDFINNYYKAGPMTGDALESYRLWHEEYSFICNNPDASIYLAGNVMLPLYNPPSDPYDIYKMYSSMTPLKNEYRRYEPLGKCAVPVKILTTEETYDSVLADVGCNARLDDQGNFIENSDEVDAGMIRDVMNGTGTDHPVDSLDWANGVVGWPEMDAGTPYTDIDKDGMADGWEMKYFGDLTTAEYDENNKTDYDADGYYDLEEFLNGSDPKKEYTGISENNNKVRAPEKFILSAYPNPFNPSATIAYSLPVSARVSLTVYNIRGKKIVNIIDNILQSPGRHEIIWKAVDNRGRKLSSGIYFLHLDAGEYNKTVKITLLR